MLKRVQNWRVVFFLIFVLFSATACSTSVPESEAVTAISAVETDAIVEVVLAEVESRLAQQDVPFVEPTVDSAEIAAMVLAEVTAQLDQRTPAAAQTVDVNAITETVFEQVESRLEQQLETALAASNADIETALIRLYQQANPAVVYIVIPAGGSGSGFVYNADGYIVTNNHVVENGRNYEVVFSNGERRRAELVGRDVDSDLAVIKVDRLPDGVEPLPLAELDGIQVGQFVVAIGNPFGEQGSMSLGIISGLDRSLRSQRGRTAGSS